MPSKYSSSAPRRGEQPLLPLVRQPTLILAGDDDPIIPVINARIMHRLIPGSELTIYHGGHLDLITEAGHLAPVVEAFLTAAAQRTRAAGPLVWVPGPKGSGSGRARSCGLYIVPLGS